MTEVLLNALLGLAVLAALISAWRLHKDKSSSFNLFDLIMHEGKVSRTAIQEATVFVVMTWGFVVYVNKGSLAEWYVMTYVGAFCLRSAYSAYLQNKSGNGNEPKAPAQKVS